RQPAQFGGPFSWAFRACQRSVGRGRRAAVWGDPKRGKVRVGVTATDAPFLRAVVTPIGVIKLVQGGADACGSSVRAAVKPERVAQRSSEIEVDRVVIAVAVRALEPRVKPLSDRPQVSPDEEVEAHDLSVSDLIAKPLREIDPDRRAAIVSADASVLLRGPERVPV